jgi:geranylgeranyl diphosphate synthase, type I
VPLGEAFQLRDDVLGAFGDSALTGKPVGEDIREGKPTRLRAWATQAATGEDAEALDRLYGASDLDETGLRRVQQILTDTGALSTAEAEIEALVTEATTALPVLDITPEGKAMLGDLATFVAERSQ